MRGGLRESDVYYIGIGSEIVKVGGEMQDEMELIK